ncbi:NAD-P-binding protein [Mycena alexandri]|uniref:NAD-P-binding protein n=1 Tax=Mycena alexandri TaxID=1745969 RepID=A0AAD6T280_9AGAR|nr:NAD-P-binding protein [Mycena alexandri]
MYSLPSSLTAGNNIIIQLSIKCKSTKYSFSRSKERAESAISRLKSGTGKEAFFIQLDLSDLDSETQLDVLFNNGGVMNTPIEELTKQGFDMQFGTLPSPQKCLLPLLLAAAQSSPDKKARVVNQSSSAQMFVDTIHLDALTDRPARKKLGKFGNIVLSDDLARRYGPEGIVSTSGNPGNNKTDLQRHTPGAFMMLFVPQMLGLDVFPCPLRYLIPWARVGVMRKEAADLVLGEQLWNWPEEQTKE